MKAAYLGLVSTLLLGLGVFGGCGGTSDVGDESSAGASDGGSGGSTGGKGTSQGGSSTNGGDNGAGESSVDQCAPGDCGPQLGLPNWTCEDGSVGGPTGRCLQRVGGSCGWEINDCPPAGEGGASSQGGQGNAAGSPGAGGAAPEACSGCFDNDQICIYQVGGPGPSHFTCATQLPCGAAGACACIQGQGACDMNLAADGYCHCDNGLD